MSADDIKDKPRQCQQIIQQMMGHWFGKENIPAGLNLREREIVRFLIAQAKPITPKEASEALEVSAHYARKLLRGLTTKNVIAPSAGNARIRSYCLINYPSKSFT